MTCARQLLKKKGESHTETENFNYQKNHPKKQKRSFLQNSDIYNNFVLHGKPELDSSLIEKKSLIHAVNQL